MYIVIELQTNTDSTVGSLITQHTDRAEAESKYYSVLAAAAVSALPVHAAALMTSEGFPIMHQCYKHTAQPAPVEEDVEPEQEA